MNIETTVLFAYKDYYKLSLPEVKRAREWFAKEQLELSEEERRRFADAGQFHFSSKEEEERFILWYYINFVTVRREKGWDVEIYNPPLTKITGIKKYPISIYEEEGEICYKKCDSNHADIWSVHAQTIEREYCIADCKNEKVAAKFEELIRNVIKNVVDLP